jgi:hypothetical protein
MLRCRWGGNALVRADVPPYTSHSVSVITCVSALPFFSLSPAWLHSITDTERTTLHPRGKEEDIARQVVSDVSEPTSLARALDYPPGPQDSLSPVGQGSQDYPRHNGRVLLRWRGGGFRPDKSFPTFPKQPLLPPPWGRRPARARAIP